MNVWAKGSNTCYTIAGVHTVYTSGSHPEVKLDPDFNYTHPSEVSQSVYVGSTLQLVAIPFSHCQSGRPSFSHSSTVWAAQICL